MIINWIDGLDRCFAGIQKSLTSVRNLKGERKYYEYRRTVLPYAVWISENLNYGDLVELTADYNDYIYEVMTMCSKYRCFICTCTAQVFSNILMIVPVY